MRLAVVGTGYVGAVSATCFASVGHQVIGLESDPERATQLSRGQLPFYEPDLPELLGRVLRERRLRVTSDPAAAIPHAELVFLCVGTPDEGDGRPDLAQVEEAVASLAPYLHRGTVVITKSTLPVGSAERLSRWLRAAGHAEAEVVSNPEFLREGDAVSDFLHPARIVLGGSPDAVARVLQAYRPIVERSFPGPSRARPQVFVTGATSAELVKYAANAFLATKISFANEIAGLCEALGADAREVLPAVGADPRIAPDFLRPGLGWGGSCLPKDIGALIGQARERDRPASLLEAAREINLRRVDELVERLRDLIGPLEGRRVAVLGLSFKPGTDDLRDAPALRLVRALLAEACLVRAHDPMVKEPLPGMEGLEICPDPYDASDRAEAVVVATEWPAYRLMDFAALAARMEGTVVLDGRNCLPSEQVARAGLRHSGVGW